MPVIEAPADALSARVAEASRLREMVADARPENASRPISSYSPRQENINMCTMRKRKGEKAK